MLLYPDYSPSVLVAGIVTNSNVSGQSKSLQGRRIEENVRGLFSNLHKYIRDNDSAENMDIKVCGKTLYTYGYSLIGLTNITQLAELTNEELENKDVEESRAAVEFSLKSVDSRIRSQFYTLLKIYGGDDRPPSSFAHPVVPFDKYLSVNEDQGLSNFIGSLIGIYSVVIGSILIKVDFKDMLNLKEKDIHTILTSEPFGTDESDRLISLAATACAMLTRIESMIGIDFDDPFSVLIKTLSKKSELVERHQSIMIGLYSDIPVVLFRLKVRDLYRGNVLVANKYAVGTVVSHANSSREGHIDFKPVNTGTFDVDEFCDMISILVKHKNDIIGKSITDVRSRLYTWYAIYTIDRWLSDSIDNLLNSGKPIRFAGNLKINIGGKKYSIAQLPYSEGKEKVISIVEALFARVYEEYKVTYMTKVGKHPDESVSEVVKGFQYLQTMPQKSTLGEFPNMESAVTGYRAMRVPYVLSVGNFNAHERRFFADSDGLHKYKHILSKVDKMNVPGVSDMFRSPYDILTNGDFTTSHLGDDEAEEIINTLKSMDNKTFVEYLNL